MLVCVQLRIVARAGQKYVCDTDTRHLMRLQAVDAVFESVEKVYTVFSVTINYFWIQLMDLAMHMGPPQAEADSDADRFDEFLTRSPWLLDSNLVVEYYTKETLFHTPKSMTEFVLPDVKPLPSIIKFNVGVSADGQPKQ